MKEIGWTHNVVIMEKCKDNLQREFYIRMTRKMGWTVNVLTIQIENQTYERTLLNQVNFDKTLPENIRNRAKLSVKDEYVGKMQFYLAVLDDTAKLEGENPSIGIILCKEKNRTVVEV